MKIAILGTRGIPNNHGGFEQFAEHLSVYLVQHGYEVIVYNSHLHPYQKDTFNGVNLIHCYDPETSIGTVGQFIYDFNCILDLRKRHVDVILQLGYTSSSVWHWVLPKKPILITNMDGMEWKRSKYNPMVRRFLKFAEQLAVTSSDYLISDSVGIQDYIENTYNKTSTYIAYGALVFENPKQDVLSNYGVTAYNYGVIIARLEPENNIRTIVEGFHQSKATYHLIVFGTLNAFGKKLQKKYAADERIRFVGANYNQEELNNIRYFSRYYFHGHSVGGTNPSLLEAMASSALIIAHKNRFNQSILNEDGFYFETSSDVEAILNSDILFENKQNFGVHNRSKIDTKYHWNSINQQYENFMLEKIGKN